jgi:hypothetical protein
MRDVFLFVSANHTKTEKPNTRHLYPTFDAQRTLFMSSACYSRNPDLCMQNNLEISRV